MMIEVSDLMHRGVCRIQKPDLTIFSFYECMLWKISVFFTLVEVSFIEYFIISTEQDKIVVGMSIEIFFVAFARRQSTIDQKIV